MLASENPLLLGSREYKELDEDALDGSVVSCQLQRFSRLASSATCSRMSLPPPSALSCSVVPRMESTAPQGMKVTRFSMPSSISLHTSMPRWPNLWRWNTPERASGSDTARLLGPSGYAGIAGPARYLPTTQFPNRLVRTVSQFGCRRS